jgi:hypothetical protein
MNKPFALLGQAACASALLLALHGAHAAAGASSPDAAQPVTGVRVGGGPADEAFRTAQRESGAKYRQSLAACKTAAAAERSACRATARAELKRAHAEANAARAAAKKVR